MSSEDKEIVRPSAANNAIVYLKLSGTAALTTGAIVLALTYGLVILWMLAVAAGLFALPYLLKALKIIFEIFDQGAETYIKLSTHAASMRQIRAESFVRVDPDELGNYPALVDPSGRLINYIRPGNSATAPSTINYVESDVEEIEDDDEMEPLQLTAPGSIDPATVSALSMAQELEKGMIRPGQPASYGWRIVNDPFTGRWSLEEITDLPAATTFFLGWSSSGKSALLSACATRRIVETYGRCILLIVDPHKGNPEKSITAKIRPALDPWIYQPKGGETITGKNPRELRALVNFLKAERDLRLERDDLTPDQKMRMSPVAMLPVWLIVDEALVFARESRIAGHDPVYDEFTALLQSVATETAKAGITGAYMAQLGTKKQLGDMEIRDVCPQQVILRTPKDQAATLGLSAPEASAAHKFPKGRGFITLADGGDPELFVWGYATPEDIAQAVDGLSSPLVPAWKQAGNKIINLRSDPETSPHYDAPYDAEMGWKEDGNGYVSNEFPAALQAELSKIQGWTEKLEILETVIGGDRGDIFKSLFGRAPGGRNNAELAQQYEVLAEAVRYRYQQARERAQ